MSPAKRRPTFRSLIQRRTSASRAVTLRWAKRRNLRVVSSANQRCTRFSRDELSDLQARPVYHRKRDSVVARLTIVFAASPRQALVALLASETDPRLAELLADSVAELHPTVHDLSTCRTWTIQPPAALLVAVRRNSALPDWLAALPTLLRRPG